jgi:hypothetical protein
MDVIGPASDVTCGKRCELKLSPGLYQLVVTHHNGDRSIQKVRVSGPSRIIVTPENRTVRFSGFLLMAMGAGIYIAGAFGLLWGALDKMGEEGASCAAGDCDLVYAGLVGMGAGAVVGGIGAVMYLVNRRPHVDVTPPLEPPPSAAPPPQARLQLQPAAGPRWMGLALSGSF